MKNVILVSALALFATIDASATTCSIACEHHWVRIVASENSNVADHAAFRRYCQELGGITQLVQGSIWCEKYETDVSTEYGSGSNSYEATLQANQACRSQACSSSCPSGTRSHNAYPSGAAASCG